MSTIVNLNFSFPISCSDSLIPFSLHWSGSRTTKRSSKAFVFRIWLQLSRSSGSYWNPESEYFAIRLMRVRISLRCRGCFNSCHFSHQFRYYFHFLHVGSEGSVVILFIVVSPSHWVPDSKSRTCRWCSYCTCFDADRPRISLFL